MKNRNEKVEKIALEIFENLKSKDISIAESEMVIRRLEQLIRWLTKIKE